MLHRSASSCLALGTLAAAMLLAPAFLPAPALGQATPAPRAGAAAAEPAKVTLSLRDVPLRTALETLFEGSGLQHAVEPAVPNYPITLDIRDVAFNTALRTLLRLAPQVTYRKEGDIFIIGMRQPQVDTTATTQDVQPPDDTNAQPQYEYVKLPLNFSNYQVMAYVLGGQPIPDEAQISGGGGGGYGGGGGGISGGG
jgi:type II secretory pathway component HofQ